MDFDEALNDIGIDPNWGADMTKNGNVMACCGLRTYPYRDCPERDNCKGYYKNKKESEYDQIMEFFYAMGSGPCGGFFPIREDVCQKVSK